MLVLFLSAAILGAVALEIVFHQLRNRYEVEWVPLCETKETDIAAEIVRAMKRDRAEAERQMNTPFKVASPAHW